MRDGAERGFQIEVLSDCCSGFSPEVHGTFIQVMSSLGQFGAPVSVSTLADFEKA